MIIQYFSDLHLEFFNKYNVVKNGDVLILAGDIGNPYDKNYSVFLQEMSILFPKIFLIAGNHEYYGETIENTNYTIKQITDKIPNISFLNNSIEEYQGYTFVGTVLWSNLINPCYLTCDRKKIKNMSYTQLNQLHQECISFLKTIKNYNNVIVISHYLPSMTLTDKRFDGRYDQCYASDLDYLITKPVLYWFYGHTHSQNETVINNVKLLCNPIGYPNENKHIDFNKNIEINEY